MNDVDICNLALDLLKEGPVTSLTEDRPVARWLNRNYPVARDAMLKRHDWNFAMARAVLPALAEPPALGWSYAYQLPPDCLRLVPMTHDGTAEGVPVSHEVEDGCILTDAEPPLKIRYVRRTLNCDKYSPEFVTALSARLALGMAHWLTGKSGYVQIIQGILDTAISDAWAMDAMEGTVARGANDEWINVR